MIVPAPSIAATVRRDAQMDAATGGNPNPDLVLLLQTNHVGILNQDLRRSYCAETLLLNVLVPKD